MDEKMKLEDIEDNTSTSSRSVHDARLMALLNTRNANVDIEEEYDNDAESDNDEAVTIISDLLRATRRKCRRSSEELIVISNSENDEEACLVQDIFDQFDEYDWMDDCLDADEQEGEPEYPRWDEYVISGPFVEDENLDDDKGYISDNDCAADDEDINNPGMFITSLNREFEEDRRSRIRHHQECHVSRFLIVILRMLKQPMLTLSSARGLLQAGYRLLDQWAEANDERQLAADIDRFSRTGSAIERRYNNRSAPIVRFFNQLNKRHDIILERIKDADKLIRFENYVFKCHDFSLSS